MFGVTADLAKPSVFASLYTPHGLFGLAADLAKPSVFASLYTPHGLFGLAADFASLYPPYDKLEVFRRTQGG